MADATMPRFNSAKTRQSALAMLELGIKFLIAYFLGSIMGALVVGRLYGGVDIRKLGSENPGGTNALRTQGAAFAIAVVIIDVGKGVIGAAVVPGLDLPFVGIDPAVSRTWLTLACAAAAVVGHVWPIYHRFRGGKGGATYVGALIVLAPTLMFLLIGVFTLVLILSGFVGLSTMLAAVALPVWIGLMELPEQWPLFVYLVCMALLIVYCHRANIQRMWAGIENRNPRVMLFRRHDPEDTSKPGAADDEPA